MSATKTKIAGRQTVEQRRRAREARRLATAPPPPRTELGEFVEITKAAAVDVEDPIAGHVKTDHQGAVGSLEEVYYNPERRQHMGRVRVGQRADGSGGQLRGIPVERLKGVGSRGARERVEDLKSDVRAGGKATHFGPLGISQERFDQIFKKGKQRTS